MAESPGAAPSAARAPDPTSRVLDIAGGHRLPPPVENSVAVDAAFHIGLQDAPFYDREAVNPTQPVRFDGECSGGLETLLEARINEVHHQLELQFDIVKDRRADEGYALVRAGIAREQSERAHAAAEERLAALREDHPDIDATSLPRPPGKRGQARDASFWVLLACFGLAEGVVNYVAMLYLRDATWITAALAVSVSLGMLGAFFYLAKLPSLRPTVGVLTAASALVLVALGTGALRYEYTRGAILRGLLRTEGGTQTPSLSTFMVVALLAFSFGLPLLFGAITFLKVRGSTFTTVARVCDLREAVLEADDELADAERILIEAGNGRRNAESAVGELISATESIIRFDAAARVGVRGAYYRGVAHGLADPAVTARLDRRFDQALSAGAAAIEKSLEEATGRLHELAARTDARLAETQGKEGV